MKYSILTFQLSEKPKNRFSTNFKQIAKKKNGNLKSRLRNHTISMHTFGLPPQGLKG